MFQHTAARRRLALSAVNVNDKVEFQHTAARRRLGQYRRVQRVCFRVSTHSRPKAAGTMDGYAACEGDVSTHSRPKAAGRYLENQRQKRNGFNTQPPEGGWTEVYFKDEDGVIVSTHSRPKAAGYPNATLAILETVSTHSRPKAAGFQSLASFKYSAFQHTAARRRLGGGYIFCSGCSQTAFQHTAARRRLGEDGFKKGNETMFQHTAARRRLEPLSKALLHQVSQPRFR